MSREKDMIKPFEFTLKINDNIICQRYFNVKKYNNDCRESLEIKEMMDDIMGVNQKLQLGLIPEFFKYKCMEYAYDEEYNDYSKDDIFTLEVSKNNINKLRSSNSDFELEDLQKETLISGSFDGKLFHPNVRYEINIRSIIPDIIRTIQNGLNHKTYTNVYGATKLERHNRLSYEDRVKAELV